MSMANADRIIIALDVQTKDEGIALVSRLQDARTFKVGLELFTAEGPAFFKKLKALRSRGELIASFSDGKLWLALNMPMDTLDPDLSVPFTDASQTSRILAQLRSVLGIVEDLGLNTRIWTKS